MKEDAPYPVRVCAAFILLALLVMLGACDSKESALTTNADSDSAIAAGPGQTRLPDASGRAASSGGQDASSLAITGDSASTAIPVLGPDTAKLDRSIQRYLQGLQPDRFTRPASTPLPGQLEDALVRDAVNTYMVGYQEFVEHPETLIFSDSGLTREYFSDAWDAPDEGRLEAYRQSFARAIEHVVHVENDKIDPGIRLVESLSDNSTAPLYEVLYSGMSSEIIEVLKVDPTSAEAGSGAIRMARVRVQYRQPELAPLAAAGAGSEQRTRQAVLRVFLDRWSDAEDSDAAYKIIAYSSEPKQSLSFAEDNGLPGTGLSSTGSQSDGAAGNAERAANDIPVLSLDQATQNSARYSDASVTKLQKRLQQSAWAIPPQPEYLYDDSPRRTGLSTLWSDPSEFPDDRDAQRRSYDELFATAETYRELSRLLLVGAGDALRRRDIQAGYELADRSDHMAQLMRISQGAAGQIFVHDLDEGAAGARSVCKESRSSTEYDPSAALGPWGCSLMDAIDSIARFSVYSDPGLSALGGERELLTEALATGLALAPVDMQGVAIGDVIERGSPPIRQLVELSDLLFIAAEGPDLEPIMEATALQREGTAARQLAPQLVAKVAISVQLAMTSQAFARGVSDEQWIELQGLAQTGVPASNTRGTTSAPSSGLILYSRQAPDSGAQSGALENSRVAALQQQLTQLGYDTGPVDGVYGPKTESAVRSYQKTNRLEENGEVTPELFTHLEMTREDAGSAPDQSESSSTGWFDNLLKSLKSTDTPDEPWEDGWSGGER